MPVRFGVLGTGYWADTCHAAGLAAHPDVELVGVWGRDAAKTARVAERHGATAETDLDELLGKVDAVAIAVAPDVQAELACRAAAAGCHLLLEKPLAVSPQAADAVVDAVERASVASLTFFTWRYMDPMAAWFRETVAPVEWHGATLTLLAAIIGSDSPFAQSAWRHEQGVLWDAVPHALSLLLPALGPVTEVSGTRGRGETLHLTFGHASGGASVATVSLSAPKPAERFGLEFWGPAGCTAIPTEGGSVEAAYAAALGDLLAAIDGGPQPACDARFAAEVVRVLAATDRFLARPDERRGERPQSG